MSSAVCPRCDVPRIDAPDCPQCGVVYAKAERVAAERAAAEAEVEMFPVPAAPSRPSAAALFGRGHALEQARAELWLARLAVPGALVLFALLDRTESGAFLVRTFCGMWLHELGHAAAAWICAFPAMPGPWVTSISDQRSYVFFLALAAGLGCVIWRGRENEDRLLMAAGAAGLLALLIGTFGLSVRTAGTFITFGGDAGSLVFGAALMATFYVPADHKLRRDWLRWGFLAIGAASFVDTFGEWWTARTDPSAIPYGEIEGVGETDVTKLLARDGWTQSKMISRYVSLGVVSLLALVPLQILHMRRSKAAVEELEG